MGSWTIKDITDFLYMFGVPVLYLITLVMSVIVIAGRNKKIRILGVWSALSIFQALLTRIPITFMFMYSRGMIDFADYDEFEITYRNMVTLSSYIGFVLVIMASVLMWLYVKRSYGVGPVPLILAVGFQFLAPVVSVILHKIIQRYSGLQGNPGSLMISVVSSIFPLVIACVFYFIFYKNRGIEKDIHSFWVFRLMNLIASALMVIILVLAIPFYQDDSFELWNEIISIIMSFIPLFTALYLFMRSRVHSSESAVTEAVDEE